MNSELPVVLEPGIAQKLQFAVNRNKGTLTDVEWLSSGDNFKNVSLLARGEAELVIKTKSASKQEVVNPIIRVNRRIRPSYPEWVRKVMHPELETVGPAEYSITKVEQWLHDGQKHGKWIEGNKIYAHLKDTDTLKTCFGLRDLEEIQKKDIAFFRTYFKFDATFGWASVVQHRDDSLCVPCLDDGGNEIVLEWCRLDDDWHSHDPGLRHAS